MIDESWDRRDMAGAAICSQFECSRERVKLVLACSSIQPRLDGRTKEARRHMAHVLPVMLPSDQPSASLFGSVRQ